MAGSADEWIPLSRPLRVEIATVRVHAERAELGVTLEAVLLPVTTDARLETLARGLPVAEQPDAFRVVVDHARHADRQAAAGAVAVRAEGLPVMAVGAFQTAREGVDRMALQESTRVEDRLATRRVALRTGGSLVTGRTRSARGRGLLGVLAREAAGVV